MRTEEKGGRGRYRDGQREERERGEERGRDGGGGQRQGQRGGGGERVGDREREVTETDRQTDRQIETETG